MASISRVFGFLTDANAANPAPAGFDKHVRLLVANGDATPDLSDGYPYYMGPDESVDFNMPIIAYTVKDPEGTYTQFNTIGDQGIDGDAGIDPAWIAFKRLSANTNSAFIAAATAVSTAQQSPQNFATAGEALTWLFANSCWTNFQEQVEATTTQAPVVTYFSVRSCGTNPLITGVGASYDIIQPGNVYLKDGTQPNDAKWEQDVNILVTDYLSEGPADVWITSAAGSCGDAV